MNSETIEYLKTLPGGLWSTDEKKNRLYELVLQCATEFPNTELLSVELGIYSGVSLFCLGKAHVDLNNGFAVGVDNWRNADCLDGNLSEADKKWWAETDLDAIYRTFKGAMTNPLWFAKTSYIRDNTIGAERHFKDNTITLLHQDATHSKESIVEELKGWSVKIRIGGYWIIDDTNWASAIEGYAKLPEFGFELVEQLETWAIYKKVK